MNALIPLLISKAITYGGAGHPLEGHASYPRDGENLVPVLVLPDWHGQTPFSEDLTRRLAEQGYFAFSVDLFGKGVHPNESEAPQNAAVYLQDRALMRTRLAAALDELRTFPMVDASAVYAVGFSFGGPVAVELAEMSPLVKKTVVLWGALATPNTVARSSKSSFLLLQGAKDPFAPPEAVTSFASALRRADVRVETVLYPDGYHAFGHTYVGDLAQYGIKYDPQLAADAWTRTLTFLENNQ